MVLFPLTCVRLVHCWNSWSTQKKQTMFIGQNYSYELKRKHSGKLNMLQHWRKIHPQNFLWESCCVLGLSLQQSWDKKIKNRFKFLSFFLSLSSHLHEWLQHCRQETKFFRLWVQSYYKDQWKESMHSQYLDFKIWK